MDDLDRLEGVAAAADAGAAAMDAPQDQAGAAPGGELLPAGPDFNLEARGAVDMFAAMVTGYAPKAADVWTEPAKARTAAALAPVMEKYGFSFGALPPELTLAIVAGPLLWQSSRIVAAQMAEDKAKAKAQAADQARQTPQQQVEPGSGADAVQRAMQPEPTGAPASAPATAVHDQMRLYR